MMLKASLQIGLLALGLSMAPAWAEGPAGTDTQVKVQKKGDLVTIDLRMTMPATPQEVWSVLVDFDHMSGFLHNLQSSRIVAKNGDVWRVEQTGQTSHAGFSFSFESVRDITLKPFESLQSHLVSGTLKRHDTLTQMVPDERGTRLTYHADSISGVWIPPLLGTSVVEDEVRKQFQDIQAEILKRQAAR
jgi:uncharacterized protein YndB with AHSA1/START domain